ncbi:uncharacterized protein [Oscarella lobularis]|uniref:uncharacterized protein n=1 Tax=Oscarella lobularis TaxID=121494 RepID=UPI003313D010
MSCANDSTASKPSTTSTATLESDLLRDDSPDEALMDVSQMSREEEDRILFLDEEEEEDACKYNRFESERGPTVADTPSTRGHTPTEVKRESKNTKKTSKATRWSIERATEVVQLPPCVPPNQYYSSGGRPANPYVRFYPSHQWTHPLPKYRPPFYYRCPPPPPPPYHHHHHTLRYPSPVSVGTGREGLFFAPVKSNKPAAVLPLPLPVPVARKRVQAQPSSVEPTAPAQTSPAPAQTSSVQTLPVQTPPVQTRTRRTELKTTKKIKPIVFDEEVSDKEARSQKKSSCGYYLAANSQSKIVISNLARHVTRLKLMELMKDIGPVKSFDMDVGRSEVSKKAVVAFHNPKHALACRRRYDREFLEGQRVSVHFGSQE